MSDVTMLKNMENILVCPSTGGKLILSDDHLYFISRAAGLKYPIRNHIPIMVIEEAEELET